MFLFFHSEQKETNTSYYKGILFESLLKQYLNASGYDVSIRKKHNSLEYDIEGEDRATKSKLIGEAKAHTASIAGQVLSSFVGKLLPLGLIEKKIKGLFLSTASLTPEADDYYSQITNLGIRSITGEELHNSIRTELKLPEFEPLAKQLRERNYSPQQDHILTTNHSNFIVITAGSSSSATPAYFAVFQPNGQILSDKKFLTQLSENVTELKTLQPIISDTYTPSITERIIRKGLVVGVDWTDYRFPAAPQFYVGREDFIKRLSDYITSNSIPNIIQIKSRSGVGKSSTLAFLENELSSQNFITELHDARDVRSILDIYTLIQRFSESENSPRDFRAVEEQLASLAQKIGNSHAVFMVDQFESTFTNVEVFQAYETLATLFLKHTPKLWICFARKNDQITTYDDSKVSLEKLNSISKAFELKDFNQKEAAELIDRANSTSARPVGKDVLAYVLEFAQGFPWLVKRTIAHITRLSAAGISQGELFAAGLRLDDLFDEELEGLDEIEREYLTKIAARLPADYNQLQNQFDDDPLLPKVLDKLTQSRLLRLSGITYDTYNDVFKEYLVYRKLPEFRQSIIYRNPPGKTLKSLHWAVTREKFTIEEFESSFGILRGSAFNRIRELTALNLVRRDENGWRVPRTVIDIFQQGRLGEYLRRQLSDNPLVANLINKIIQSEEINSSDLSDYLEKHFPFVEATNKTWSSYATSLLSWLTTTKILEVGDDGRFIIPNEERSKIIESLGNLSIVSGRTGRGRRANENILFLPTVVYKTAESVAKSLLNGEEIIGKQAKKALMDFRSLNLIADGKAKFISMEDFNERLLKILNSAPYSELWVSIKNNQSPIQTFEKILDRELSEETLKWRYRKLTNWAKRLDIIPYNKAKDDKKQNNLFV